MQAKVIPLRLQVCPEVRLKLFACESGRTDQVSCPATNVATNFKLFQNITSLLAAT